jgi:hypothetical protein
MDTHFSNVLGQPASSQTPQITFIPAASFEGRRSGYKFQKGSKGLGYYYDRFQSKASTAPSVPEAEVCNRLSPVPANELMVHAFSLYLSQRLRPMLVSGNETRVKTQRTACLCSYK